MSASTDTDLDAWFAFLLEAELLVVKVNAAERELAGELVAS